MRSTSLKPFKHEFDPDRSYDILRAIIFHRAKSKFKDKKGSSLRFIFNKCRNDTGEIIKLRRRFPIINHETIKKIAKNFKVEFLFLDSKKFTVTS